MHKKSTLLTATPSLLTDTHTKKKTKASSGIIENVHKMSDPYHRTWCHPIVYYELELMRYVPTYLDTHFFKSCACKYNFSHRLKVPSSLNPYIYFRLRRDSIYAHLYARTKVFFNTGLIWYSWILSSSLQCFPFVVFGLRSGGSSRHKSLLVFTACKKYPVF